ncbi:MAG: hypothetical protein CME06_11145 [Gemmatimonadetes bacterium]|nr:hypothetical protein [Gemmatimonadota bacterium]
MKLQSTPPIPASDRQSPPAVLTLGPASCDAAILAQLLPVAERFRLNSAHLDPGGLVGWLDRLEALFEAEGRSVPVVVDLQGAKMRIGRFPSIPRLPGRVELVPGDRSERADTIPVPHPGLFRHAAPGDRLFLNDARVELEIERVGDERIGARTVRNGPLEASKGINRAPHPLPFEALSDRDASMIDASIGRPFVEYALSFVRSAQDAGLLRPRLGGHRLIAKLERTEAIAHVREIDAAFDESWLCRGDLGAQAGVGELGPIQRRIATLIPSLRNPCYLAGQVLEHMTHFPEPTRSEVVHLYEVARSGFAGVVLSDETAIGRHVAEVAGFLARAAPEE